MFICNFIGINHLNIAIAIRGSTYVKGILILQRADSIYMFVEDVIEVNLSGLIIIILSVSSSHWWFFPAPGITVVDVKCSFSACPKKISSCLILLMCVVAQSCLPLCSPMDYSPPGSSVHGDFPGKNTGVGFHALLQGIFSTQGSKPSLPHCRWILYWLSHQGMR